jgi:hypothetical protein
MVGLAWGVLSSAVFIGGLIEQSLLQCNMILRRNTH